MLFLLSLSYLAQLAWSAANSHVQLTLWEKCYQSLMYFYQYYNTIMWQKLIKNCNCHNARNECSLSCHIILVGILDTNPKHTYMCNVYVCQTISLHFLKASKKLGEIELLSRRHLGSNDQSVLREKQNWCFFLN